MYVIYWQNFSVNPSVIFDSKLQGPNPGLGCIHIKWLWIIYFRNDRLEKMCFAHEKWNPTAHQVSCFLEVLIFPFSPYFNFSSLSLKGLERIWKQTRKGLATHFLAPGEVRPHSWRRGRKQSQSQVTVGITLGRWAGSWEEGWWLMCCRLTWVRRHGQALTERKGGVLMMLQSLPRRDSHHWGDSSWFI